MQLASEAQGFGYESHLGVDYGMNSGVDASAEIVHQVVSTHWKLVVSHASQLHPVRT